MDKKPGETLRFKENCKKCKTASNLTIELTDDVINSIKNTGITTALGICDSGHLQCCYLDKHYKLRGIDLVHYAVPKGISAKNLASSYFSQGYFGLGIFYVPATKNIERTKMIIPADDKYTEIAESDLFNKNIDYLIANPELKELLITNTGIKVDNKDVTSYFVRLFGTTTNELFWDDEIPEINTKEFYGFYESFDPVVGLCFHNKNFTIYELRESGLSLLKQLVTELRKIESQD